MKKNLFAAALACVLALTGIGLSAQEESSGWRAFAQKSKIQFNRESNTFSSNDEMLIAFAAKNDNLLDNLKTLAEDSSSGQLGFMADGHFVSLKDALKTAEDTSADVTGESVIRLRKFSAQNLQFGLNSQTGFTPFTGVAGDVVSDPFYGGYNVDSFYSVDFAEYPFDGMIDILVMGEPLPAPVVTLLIALVSGAALLMYKNRKQRAFHVEQA